MTRDPDSIPYRKTADYARAVTMAAIQRARMRHHVHELWAQNVGQSTSGMMRRPRFAHTT